MSGANATSTRKPLDPRIPNLISSSLSTSHRSFFLLLGDLPRLHSQIVNLHFLLSQSISALPNPTDQQKKQGRPKVLWCYKKDLGFSSNRRKREGKLKRDRKGKEGEEMDPFELFVSVTDVRYTYYKDTHKILGQTYGMLVLQDFEAITPNLLARTIETVQGGGIVVCLLTGMKSLRGLYSLSMDVHARYRSALSPGAPTARFNERFLLSLSSSPACLILDDELNVLPISSSSSQISTAGTVGLASSSSKARRVESPSEASLAKLKDSLASTPAIGSVLSLCLTLDQATSLLEFSSVLTSSTSSSSLSTTISLTAPRGRGKSATLGLALALAMIGGFTNVFVTSPSPENLGTVWEFACKGLEAAGWVEHLDWEVIESGREEWKGVTVRVECFRGHRQTIQYIQPSDAQLLSQAELLVIDEAAAIPLPILRSLFGPYLVFLSSTTDGYEGTGRSLSLKLLQSLREAARPSSGAPSASAAPAPTSTSAMSKRALKELSLSTPIRYGPNDPIEAWLTQLLCLAPPASSSSAARGTPHPSTCDLYAVNRDTLFSYHPASEVFLQRIMGLYTSSHYKNTPNDLQLISDAPGQRVFVLLGPVKSEADGGEGERLPEPLVVVQVALEGHIGKDAVRDGLGRGKLAGGDLIPWTISQQYQDDEFAGMSGARVVRIAVHPDYSKMGYGSRALQALNSFYSGELLNLDEIAVEEEELVTFEDVAKVSANATAFTDLPTVRSADHMPPLLQTLSSISPEALDYLGVSYGLTPLLFKFWKRAGFAPLYIRQTQNELTGEHTVVMLRGLNKNQEETERWLGEFSIDFRKRFIALLSYKFREFASVTALSILEATSTAAGDATRERRPLTSSEVTTVFSPFDLKRLDSYANNMLDYHVILDLLPTLASLYFTQKFPVDVKLSGVQSSILLSLGLQRKAVEDVEKELQLPVAQSLALFVKTIRKMTRALQDIQKASIESQLPKASSQATLALPLASTSATAGAGDIETDLREEGDAVLKQLREQQREVIDSLDLKQYAVGGNEDEWAAAQRKVADRIVDPSKAPGSLGVVSVKNAQSTKRKSREEGDGEQQKKKEKEGRDGKKYKKTKH